MKNNNLKLVLSLFVTLVLSACNKKQPPVAYFEPITPTYTKVSISVDGTENEDGADYTIDWGDGTKEEKTLTSGSKFILTHDYGNFFAQPTVGADDSKSYPTISLEVQSENGQITNLERTIEVIVPAPSIISYQLFSNGGSSTYTATPTYNSLSSNRVEISENGSLPTLILTCPKAVGTYTFHSSTGSSIFFTGSSVNYASYFTSGSGTITVTEVNAGRIKGTFSGECYRSDGQPFFLDVRNGSFNLLF
jgi:hypothetical protein